MSDTEQEALKRLLGGARCWRHGHMPALYAMTCLSCFQQALPEGTSIEYQASRVQGRWYTGVVADAPRKLGSTFTVRLRDMDPAYTEDHHPGQGRTTVAAASLACVRRRTDVGNTLERHRTSEGGTNMRATGEKPDPVGPLGMAGNRSDEHSALKTSESRVMTGAANRDHGSNAPSPSRPAEAPTEPGNLPCEAEGHWTNGAVSMHRDDIPCAVHAAWRAQRCAAPTGQDVHGRLQDLVDAFGVVPTMPIEWLLALLEERLPEVLSVAVSYEDRINDAIDCLHQHADELSEHVYQEFALALDAPPRDSDAALNILGGRTVKERVAEIRAEQSDTAKPCALPPSGWTCSRVAGHPGPCAASPIAVDNSLRAGSWMVTRKTSACYLGAYEWVRNPATAAHFITREAADAAADVARKSNGGVVVLPSPQQDSALNTGWSSYDDTPLPEDAAINAAFPTRSGRHDLYSEAMRLVGAKYTKRGLVALVNWLLHCVEKGQK